MHFTYKQCEGDLRQGDLLRITEPLRTMLADVHPYYARHPDYKALMVLTQSCDLVRRDKAPCKSPYINLCAVRPLETAVRRELTKFQRSHFMKTHAVCEAKHKMWGEDFLVKLFNNNLPDYFYLHEDQEAGVKEELVAFLQLAVAIKSDHYDVCLAARYAQLKEVFQAKLGWLVGHVYSRVATADWTPDNCGQDEFDQLVKDELGACPSNVRSSFNMWKRPKESSFRGWPIWDYSDTLLEEQSYWLQPREIRALERFWEQRCKQLGDDKYQLTEQEIDDTVQNCRQTVANQKLLTAVDIVLHHARKWQTAVERGRDEDWESELLADREFTRLF